MEITAQTFTELRKDLEYQHRLSIRASLGSVLLGLLPGEEFDNKGMFVRNSFEMPHFQCMALLPSGQVIQAQESVSVVIPVLYGDVYYLTVGIGDRMLEFEREGVPYIRPQYDYAIHTLEEITGTDLLPIVRFTASNGEFTVDEQYIPPVIRFSSDKRLADYQKKYIESLETLVNHEKMDTELGKRDLLHLLFQLKSFNPRGSMHAFVTLMQEVLQALRYYIVSKVDDKELVAQPNEYDIQVWLEHAQSYLASALSAIEKVEKKDDNIDFEALKAQIKEELYQGLYDELFAALLEKIKGDLQGALEEALREVLLRYIDETLKPAIIQQLGEELPPKLYEQLYQPLYDALFDALKLMPRAQEEEDQFIPLI